MLFIKTATATEWPKQMRWAFFNNPVFMSTGLNIHIGARA